MAADEGNPATPVRGEDAFDLDAVAAWLRTLPHFSPTT